MYSLRAWLGRIFDIHPEDWRPLLLLQLLIVAICAVLAAAKTVSNSLFVSHVGVSFLPYGYMASALMLAASGVLLIPLVDKMPRLAIYRFTCLGLGCLFALCYAVMLSDQTWVYYLAYLAASIADSLLFLEFWLIAADLCDSRQAKRVFPLVIGWSLIGGMLGSFGTKLLVPHTGTKPLLLICAGLLVATIGIVRAIRKAFPKETAAPDQTPLPKGQSAQGIGLWARFRLDWRIVRESPLVRLICLSLVLYSVLAFLTDFLFNTVVSQHFTANGAIDSDRLTAFYGFFDGLCITVSLLFQFFLTHHVLRAMGITNAQLLLPGAFGAGFFSMTATVLAGSVRGTFLSALGTRLGQKFLSSSIHRSSMAIVYSPISSEKRGRSKAFAEGIMQPLGAFAAGALILAIKAFPLWIVAASATAVSGAYVVAVMRLRKVYVRQILQMFECKNFAMLESFAGMFAKIGEKEIMDNLCASLGDKDFNIRNFVVELLGQVKSRAAVEPLIDLYRKEENPTVKATVIKVLGKLGSARVTALLKEALADKDDRVRANAVEAVVLSKSVELAEQLRRALKDPSARVRANAAIALWRLGKGREEAVAALQVLYQERDAVCRLSALYAMGEIASPACVQSLMEAARDADPKIAERAVRSLGGTGSESAVKTLLALLPNVSSAQQRAIAAALIRLAPSCPDIVLNSLCHPDLFVRQHLISVAATMEDKRARAALKDMALLEIESLHEHRDWQEKIHALPQQELKLLLQDTFRQLDQQARKNVLEVLRVLAGNTPAVQQIMKDIFHPNRFVRASALDALEAVGHKVIAKAFVPLLEEKAEGHAPRAEATPEELSQWTRQWLKSPYRWVRACGVFGAGKLRLAILQEELLSCLNDSYDLVRANALEALGGFGVQKHRVYIERMLNDASPLPRRYAQFLLN